MKIIQNFRHFLLTGFYLGYLPKMPGTWTSIGTFILLYPLLLLHNYYILLFLTLFFFIFGLKEIEIYEKQTGIHDDPKTSIDEVIGILFMIIFSFPIINNILLDSIILLILFRFFDIIKPGIIKFIDKNIDNSFGVIADDIIAGFYASIIFAIYKINYLNLTIY